MVSTGLPGGGGTADDFQPTSLPLLFWTQWRLNSNTWTPALQSGDTSLLCHAQLLALLVFSHTERGGGGEKDVPFLEYIIFALESHSALPLRQKVALLNKFRKPNWNYCKHTHSYAHKLPLIKILLNFTITISLQSMFWSFIALAQPCMFQS
jgi:hypothetical protein